MFRILLQCIVFITIFLSPLHSVGEKVQMAPPPDERLKYKFKRKPGGLKYNKYGLIDPSPDVISLKYFPKDKYGFVDWAQAVKDGLISPRSSITILEEEQTVGFDKDILIKSKMDFMPDVIFPHDAHNYWLNCSTCHTKIFEMKAGATPISMIAIWKGEYCGRCHDKVAFPLRNCFKCHSVPRKKK